MIFRLRAFRKRGRNHHRGIDERGIGNVVMSRRLRSSAVISGNPDPRFQKPRGLVVSMDLDRLIDPEDWNQPRAAGSLDDCSFEGGAWPSNAGFHAP